MKCKHCQRTIDLYRGHWWANDDFTCPDGEQEHAPVTVTVKIPDYIFDVVEVRDGRTIQRLRGSILAWVLMGELETLYRVKVYLKRRP